jgi:hypothetical protein
VDSLVSLIPPSHIDLPRNKTCKIVKVYENEDFYDIKAIEGKDEIY